jgi:excinuclease UvrABC ATPase subunit
VVSVDQTAIRGSRRSNPATYTGLLDPIRKAFAKANGVKPALFSANSEGACPTCNGAGVIYTDLGIMASVATTCEDCGGVHRRRRRAYAGGRIVFEGTPADLVAARSTLTGEHLATYVGT